MGVSYEVDFGRLYPIPLRTVRISHRKHLNYIVTMLEEYCSVPEFNHHNLNLQIGCVLVNISLYPPYLAGDGFANAIIRSGKSVNDI